MIKYQRMNEMRATTDRVSSLARIKKLLSELGAWCEWRNGWISMDAKRRRQQQQ
jgi:hypothetical protein